MKVDFCCEKHVYSMFSPTIRDALQPTGRPVVQSWHTDTDGKRSRMSFTFADADYIKSYVILPLYHM